MVTNDPLLKTFNEISEYKMTVEFVYVLVGTNDDGTEVLGVYTTYEAAEKEKFAIIRDYYDIPEDEVDDCDLDEEIESMGHEMNIYTRKLL